MVSGEDEMKSGAFAGRTSRGNAPAVIFYDLFTHGQANPSAAVLVFAVQSLEYTEDLIGMFRAETDTVVADLKVKALVFAIAGDRDNRRLVVFGIF